MERLKFRIVPNGISLGKAVDASIEVVSCSADALDELQGRLEYSSAIKVIGDQGIYISRLQPYESISIPIRIKGLVPGQTQITISRLTARTDGGAILDMDPLQLGINITDKPGFDPQEISFIIEPVGRLVQNVIGRSVCKLHNNSSFSLEIVSIEITAKGSDVYKGPASINGQVIQSGKALSFDLHILPRSAGVASLYLDARLRIMEKSFSKQTVIPLSIIPSGQTIAPDSPESVRTILVVTAAPADKQTIRTDKELKKILFVMKQSAQLRDAFQVEVLPAATAEELSRQIIVSRPWLVHFAGHGTKEGIILENEQEVGRVFSTTALVALLQQLSDQVECIIINACDSLAPAREIAKIIHYAVGMRQAVFDDTALEFTRGFYEAIGAGYSIEKAFQIGKAVLSDRYLDESEIPVLIVRN